MRSFPLSALCIAALLVSTTGLAAQPNSKKAAAPAKSPAAASTPIVTPAPVKTWDFAIKPDDSLFAIVTYKTGVAARLAHNHLIAARQFSAQLSADPSLLNEGKFQFKTKVNDLEFDRSDLQKRWFPTIQALGWLSEAFTSQKDSDRDTIREHAFAENQLDASKFTDIEARVEKITDSNSTAGSKKFSKKATVSLTIHGQTVKKDFAANINLQGQELAVEAVADLNFTDFSIQPYRALMGALGNENKFSMLINFRAVKK